MLFPTRGETVRCNHKMHKLALTDNCTQVLLPTQAFGSCSRHLTAAASLIPVSPGPLHQPTKSEDEAAKANFAYQCGRIKRKQ